MTDRANNLEPINGTNPAARLLTTLLSGIVLGIGVGVLFAPRRGSELRRDIGQSAGDLRRAASGKYSQASEAIRRTAARGREVAHVVSESGSKAISSVVEHGRGAVDDAHEAWEDVREAVSGATRPAESGRGYTG